MNIPKPPPADYDPYVKRYVDLLPDDGLVIDYLITNPQLVQDYVAGLPPTKLDVPCADGEWTVKEILTHLIDAERILAYRLLRFARNDTQDLPGFEQDDYVPYSHANERTLADIFEEYHAVRAATVSLVRHLDAAALARGGLTSGYRVTVAALVYMIAGHELYHLQSIQQNYG